MQCPECHQRIPDNVAICPLCDAILDPSFLNASTAPGTDDAPSPSAHALPPSDAYGSPRRSSADLSGQTEGTSLLAMDPEAQKETRIVRMEDLPTRRGDNVGRSLRTAAPAATEPAEDLGDLFGRAALAFQRLRPLEKAVLGVLATLQVATFGPWFSVQGKGYVSGIEGIGLWAAVSTAAAIAVFWIRVTFRMALLVLAQVALVLFAAGVATLGLRSPHGAQPGIGLYASLALGLLAAVLSLVAVVKH